MGRFGLPEELISSAISLASSMSSHVSGRRIVVDRGHLAV